MNALRARILAFPPLWTAMVLSVAAGLIGEVASVNWRNLAAWIPDLAVGWTFAGGGLLVMRGRPRLGAGPLLVAVGVTWFLGNLRGLDVPVAAAVGSQLVFVHRAVLVHLLLTFPTGRPRSRSAVASILAGYVLWSMPALAAVPVLTIGMVLVVVLAAARDADAVGTRRRWGRVVFAGSLVIAVAIGGATVAHGIANDGSADAIALDVYETLLAGLAVGLTVAVLFWDRDADSVTDLVLELAGPSALPAVAALREALADPTVEVGTWDAGAGRYLDGNGRALELPPAGAFRAATRVDNEDGRAMVVLHDPAILEDPALAQAVRRATRLAATNASRNRDVEEHLTAVQASRRRLLLASDAAGRDLRAQVESGALGRAAALRSLLAEAAITAASAGADAALEHIHRASGLLDEAVEDLEALAAGLDPASLIEGGLPAGLARLAASSPVPAEIRGAVGRLPAAVEAACYYVVAEALANVAKHAHARSVVVQLRPDGSDVVVEVTDDGIGGASPRAGRGLQGLADRIEALGGSLEIGGDDRGTRVVARIPVLSGAG